MKVLSIFYNGPHCHLIIFSTFGVDSCEYRFWIFLFYTYAEIRSFLSDHSLTKANAKHYYLHKQTMLWLAVKNQILAKSGYVSTSPELCRVYNSWVRSVLYSAHGCIYYCNSIFNLRTSKEYEYFLVLWIEGLRKTEFVA